MSGTVSPVAGAPGEVTEASTQSRWRPVAVVSVYGVVLALCAVYAYWKLFNTWKPYDDTGFDTYSIRLFLDGHSLYNSFFTLYGPFPFELWGAVFGILGVTPSTDAAYFATYVLWLVTSLAVGVSAHRLTGRLAIGISALVVSFVLLKAAVNEPILPDLLATTLLIALEMVCIFGLERRPVATLYAAGALVGMAALTKVNAGAYAFVAVGFAAVMALSQWRQHAWLRRCAGAVVILITPAIMAPDLSISGFTKFAFVITCAAAALVLAAGLVPQGSVVPGEARRWLRAFLVGLVVAAIVIIAVIVILGTTPRALFETDIIRASHISNLHDRPPTLRAWALLWVVIAISAALAITRTRAGRAAVTGGGPGVAIGRILCGVIIWLMPLEGFVFALSLAWVAALPSSRDKDTAASRFIRLLIPAVAIIYTLFAYPGAGSQLSFSHAMFVLCGAVCVADGLSDLELRAARGALGKITPRRARAVIASLTAALALAILLGSVALRLNGVHAQYEYGRPLPFKGATSLRLPPKQRSIFVALIAAARANCRTLLTFPGMPSLNLWSGLPAPSGYTIIGLWWQVPPAEDLEKAYTQAERSPGLCEVLNEQEIRFWAHEQPLPHIPLIRFLEHDFTTIGTYGEELEVPPRFFYRLLKRRENTSG